MTIKSTIATIRAMSPRLTARWIAETKEYRVTIDRSEASAHYTTDADDAIGTARAMLAAATPTAAERDREFLRAALLDASDALFRLVSDLCVVCPGGAEAAGRAGRAALDASAKVKP